MNGMTLFSNPFLREKNDVPNFLLNYLNFRVLFVCLSYLFSFVITHLSKFSQLKDFVQFDNNLGKKDSVQEGRFC